MNPVNRNRATWMVIGLLIVVMAVAVVGSRLDSRSTGAAIVSCVESAELSASGELLYEESCAPCHGSDLRGTDKGPSHLSIVYEPDHHGDIAFVLAAKNGVTAHHWPFGDMAPVLGLSDQNLEAIIAYVREVQRVEGFEPHPPR